MAETLSGSGFQPFYQRLQKLEAIQFTNAHLLISLWENQRDRPSGGTLIPGPRARGIQIKLHNQQQILKYRIYNGSRLGIIQVEVGVRPVHQDQDQGRSPGKR